MQVKRVSRTVPEWNLIEEGVQTPSDLIAFCARVSNPNNQLNTDTANRLLRFLIENKHWSPLEMVDVTYEIETTRDIARQILRHRSFVFQEFSQRYAEVVDWEKSEPRMQHPTNRQSSIPVIDEDLYVWWDNEQERAWNVCEGIYKRALQKGIAKEVARKVLPEGLAVSRLYMKGSLRSWIHYCQLRAHEATQDEHQAIAIQIAKDVAEVFPMAEEHMKPE